MSERPLIFTGHSVRQILAGAKTQTRRLMTPQPTRSLPHTTTACKLEIHHPMGWRWRNQFVGDEAGGLQNLRWPHGSPGQHLWVKETWCLAHPDYHSEAEGERLGRPIRDGRWCHYAATDDVSDNDGRSPWRSPVLMPRWASRITLEITEVRVERLQSITEHDALSEGVDGWVTDTRCETARDGFRLLWDSINAERAAWSSNPLVWVVSFRQLEQP